MRRYVSSFRGKGEALGVFGPLPIWYRMTVPGGTSICFAFFFLQNKQIENTERKHVKEIVTDGD